MNPRTYWIFGALAVLAIALVLGAAVNFTSAVFAIPILIVIAIGGLAIAFFANARRYRPPDDARPGAHRFTGRESRTPTSD
jgi:hypothetical protein